MVERKQMHKIRFLTFAYQWKRHGVWLTYHIHVLSDSLLKTATVFYVLTVGKPSMPEYVGTRDGKIYVVQTDGTIVCWRNNFNGSYAFALAFNLTCPSASSTENSTSWQPYCLRISSVFFCTKV